MPLLSILIVNYNGLAHLSECLSSIYGQGFKSFEVVMVDNASKDNSVSFVKNHFSDVKIVIAPSNLGFAGGNNLGLEYCQGEYVFFLNNDTRLDYDALEKLTQAIHLHSQIHIFACFLIDFKNPAKVDSAGDTLYTAGVPFSFKGFPVSRFTSDRDVTAACAGAAIYSRKVLESLGGFDEDFFLIFEDTDLSLRARHAGESILFLPSVKVFHKGSATLGTRSPVSFYYSERNFLWLLVKNYPMPWLVNTLPKFLCLKLWRFVHAVRFGCTKEYFRANRDSLKKLPEMLKKRRQILGQSHLDTKKFGRLLRPHWLKERIAFFRGEFNAPL